MKMEQTERSETLAYKIQTPGNYPEESIQDSEQGERLLSRVYFLQLDKTSISVQFSADTARPLCYILYELHSECLKFLTCSIILLSKIMFASRTYCVVAHSI
jgi:hypothetical protein